MSTDGSTEQYLFVKRIDEENKTGILLTIDHFEQIKQFVEFYISNGYLPTKTTEEIKQKEKHMTDCNGKFQVLITHKPQGTTTDNTFTCSDFTDEETAKTWCELIWDDYSKGNKFINVIKIKENLKTRLNIDDLYELEVIKSEVYAHRNFTPYWKL